MKLAALIEAIEDFDVHVVKSEPEALLLEGKLIKEFKPRYNVSFRDDKNFLLIKVNLNDPIPRFTFARLRQQDGAKYFGPFVSGGACRRTITMLRKKFNLRGCRPLNPTERDYKHCLYGHLQHCSAPCVSKVTLDEYRQKVNEACHYLEGRTGEWEKELNAKMQNAAEALDYEKAARYRDMISDLRETTRKSRKFTRMPVKLPGAIDPGRDLAALGKALGLDSPPKRIEGFDISNISGTFMVASMVSFLGGKPDRAQYRRFRMKSVVAQDDFACMAETVRRRYTPAPERGAPDAGPDSDRRRQGATWHGVPRVGKARSRAPAGDRLGKGVRGNSPTGRKNATPAWPRQRRAEAAAARARRVTPVRQHVQR